MGTPANLEALRRARRRRPTRRPADVVIAVDGAGAPARTRSPRPSASWSPRAAGDAAGGAAAAAPPRSLGAAAAGLGGANVALISVPGEYAALEAHRALTPRAARLPVLRPRGVDRRGRAQAPRRASAGCSSWARAAARRCSAASASASPTSCRPGPSASSPRRAPARRRPRACSTPPASACRRSSASAAATCRREVGGLMFRAGHARCSPRDDATETLLLVSKPPAPRRSSRRSPTPFPRASAWSPRSWACRRRGAVRGPPHARGRRAAPPPARPRPTSRARAAVDARRADRRPHAARPLLRRLAGRTRRRRSSSPRSARSPAT